MLSFVMTTCNEGGAFESTLTALAEAMEHGDRVIAFDTGSTDDTPKRLAAFGETVGCDVVRLGSVPLTHGEALGLGLQMAQTPYVMLLNPGDRLNRAHLPGLRARLASEQPDMVMLNSGWWSSDPAHMFDRVDADRVAALPAQISARALDVACPEPRRFVLSQDVWLPRGPAFAHTRTAETLYDQLLEQGGTCAIVHEPVLAHTHTHVDPVPVLDALGAFVTALPRRMQVAGFNARMIRADDAVTRTSSDAAPALIAAMEALARCLPRRLRGQLNSHDGLAGALSQSHKQGGQQGALLYLTQRALAASEAKNAILAEQLEHLHQQLHDALPAPQYLRELYDRVRAP